MLFRGVEIAATLFSLSMILEDWKLLVGSKSFFLLYTRRYHSAYSANALALSFLSHRTFYFEMNKCYEGGIQWEKKKRKATVAAARLRLRVKDINGERKRRERKAASKKRRKKAKNFASFNFLWVFFCVCFYVLSIVIHSMT